MHANQRSDTISAIDGDQGWRDALDLDGRALGNATHVQPFTIGLDSAQAMVGEAEQIGEDQDLDDVGCVFRIQAQALKGTLAQRMEFGFRDA